MTPPCLVEDRHSGIGYHVYMQPDEPRPALATPPSTRGPLAALIVACVLGLALRIWIGWWLGFLSDINCFQIWALKPGEFIPPTPQYKIPIPNYPPLYVSILRLLRWTHQALDLPGNFRTTIQFAELVGPQRPIILLLKSPSMIADLVSAVLIYAFGRHLRRPWLGVGIAIFYLFSPVILYDGAYYGQTDTILLTFLFAAVFAYVARKPACLGAMMAGSLLLKPQAIIVLMILGVAILAQWREVWRGRLRRLLAGGLGALACVAALAALTGNLESFRTGYTRTVGWFPIVTSHAFNLWWLMLRPWDKAPHEQDFPLDSERLFGLVSYRAIGLVLFLGGMLLILWLLHRRKYTPYAVMLGCAAGGWAFFNLPTEMHERYSVTAVGFMCLLPFWNRRWYLYALLASITTTLNIITLAPFCFPPSWALTRTVNWVIWPEQEKVWTVLACLHVVMLPLLLDALWRDREREAATSAAFPIAPVAAGGIRMTKPKCRKKPE